MGLPHDGEEAHLWLSRAAKQLAEILGWALDGSGGGGSSGGAGTAPSKPLPALLTLAGCRRLLAQVRARACAPLLCWLGRSSCTLPATSATALFVRASRPPCLLCVCPSLLNHAQSAHILGYLCMDGEGTRADVGAALRWFRLAQRAGCAEAGRMIGSLLNTGGWRGRDNCRGARAASAFVQLLPWGHGALHGRARTRSPQCALLLPAPCRAGQYG